MSVLATGIMLAQRGDAVHWVRPRSKAPIADGWSTAPVATITTLRQTYRPGYNVGVRCGHWSQPQPEHGLVHHRCGYSEPRGHQASPRSRRDTTQRYACSPNSAVWQW